MAKISLKDYIASGAGKFAFAKGVPGFITDETISLSILSWYRHFMEDRAAEFFLGSEILDLNGHHIVDLLICCRNALRPGGLLRFDLQAGTDAQDIEWRLHRTLASLGFAIHPLVSPGFGDAADLRPRERGQEAQPVAGRVALTAIKISDAHVGLNGTQERVYVMGDSHIWFLSGRDRKEATKDRNLGGLRFENFAGFFSGYHLGPSLAYSLGKKGTITQSTEKCEMLLTTPGYIPPGSRVMLSFGEIDCRNHVCRIAEQRGMSIEEVVEGIVTNYRGFLAMLISRGFRPIIWGPVAPSRRDDIPNTRFPVHGAFAQRKHATRYLTARLRDVGDELGIRLVSILESLFDAEGITDERFYGDPIHLSHAARPLLWEAFGRVTGLRTVWSEGR